MADFQTLNCCYTFRTQFPFQNLIWNFKVIKEVYSKTSTVMLKLRIYKGRFGSFSL